MVLTTITRLGAAKKMKREISQTTNPNGANTRRRGKANRKTRKDAARISGLLDVVAEELAGYVRLNDHQVLVLGEVKTLARPEEDYRAATAVHHTLHRCVLQRRDCVSGAETACRFHLEVVCGGEREHQISSPGVRTVTPSGEPVSSKASATASAAALADE